ncbi:MAG: tetratricopeptide repeat protein [Alphaproteobacteria bacterium]|nr:tetratricopeptide repeat protein [Alphaproteobacteria bacterium]
MMKLQQAVDAHLKGERDEASRLYNEVLQENPNEPIALHYFGVLMCQRGDFPRSEQLIRKSLAVRPGAADAMGNLGITLSAMGRFDEAIALHRQAIALRPQNADGYNNLAAALLSGERFDEAIQAASEAVRLKPGSALVWYNLGCAFQRKGRNTEALNAYRRATEVQPNFPEAFCNIGLVLVALGKREEALAAYRKAVELRPNFPEALNNMGQPLCDMRRLEEATEVYRKAVELRPEYIDAYGNLATTYRKRGMIEESLRTYEEGFARAPGNIKAEIEMANLRRHLCDWKNYEADNKRVLELAEHVEPFIFLNVPSSPAQQLLCARSWASRASRVQTFDHSRPRMPGKIRIGYLSADFRKHATAYLMAELFERHNRAEFEIYAYSYGFDDGSDIRQRLIKSFDHFVDIFATSGLDAAQAIYNDHIDILVDLKGYTGEARCDIALFRPAPVQVAYVGFPATMGADYIDYLIADPFVAPAEHQPFFTEKLVHLPHCYQPNDSKRQISSRIIQRHECKLPSEGFVFCCFNGSYKLSPTIFDIWMRLLKAVPESVLWLLATTPVVEKNLRREAEARGVDSERLVFAEGLDLPLHLARHRLADLFLDTLPICAHTTASDALWAGLPILTCVGESFVGRVAGSLLHAMGLPELITYSLEEYEARALDLAMRPDKLSELKKKLEAHRSTSPLFHIAYYTLDLEDAFRHMFNLRMEGSPPDSRVLPLEMV